MLVYVFSALKSPHILDFPLAYTIITDVIADFSSVSFTFLISPIFTKVLISSSRSFLTCGLAGQGCLLSPAGCGVQIFNYTFILCFLPLHRLFAPCEKAIGHFKQTSQTCCFSSGVISGLDSASFIASSNFFGSQVVFPHAVGPDHSMPWYLVCAFRFCSIHLFFLISPIEKYFPLLCTMSQTHIWSAILLKKRSRVVLKEPY